jgi:hypothetical protein
VGEYCHAKGGVVEEHGGMLVDVEVMEPDESGQEWGRTERGEFRISRETKSRYS